MSGFEANDFELSAGHTERLTAYTQTVITSKINKILDKFGEVKDSELSQFSPEYQAKLADTLHKMGLTEEMPIAREAIVSVEKGRLLPDYMRGAGDIEYIGVRESLTRHIYYQYRIFYGTGRNPRDRLLGDGMEVMIPWEDVRSNVMVLSRDPSTGDPVTTHLTEAQGKDILLDFRDILGE